MQTHIIYTNMLSHVQSFRKKHLRNEKLLNQGTGKKVTLIIRFSFSMLLLLMCAREGAEGRRQEGPCERLQGSEGDLQESICSSHCGLGT